MTRLLQRLSGVAVVLGAALAGLHLWRHCPIARGVFAGGSDLGFMVARAPAWLSLSLSVGGLLFAVAALRLKQDVARGAALLLLSLLMLVGVSAGRTLGVGGVRGDLTVTTGWFMFPGRTVELSSPGVEADVRAAQCTPGSAGLTLVTLTCDGQVTRFYTGPFVREEALKVLSQTFGPKQPQGGASSSTPSAAPPTLHPSPPIPDSP